MKSLVVISVFVLAVVLLFAGVFFGPRTFLDANPYHFDPWRSYAQAGDADNSTYRTDALFAYFPRRVELTRSIRSAQLPLWNPYILAGMPFFADPQSRVAYPIALLLTLVDPVDAMAYDVAIHLVLAMLGMYLFLRAIRVNVYGSILGGLAFGFSSFFYVRLGHSTFIAAASWIPFFFYGFEQARKRWRIGTVLLAAFLAMGYLAGFPQVFLFGVGALGFYGLYTCLDTGGAARKREILRVIRILFIAGGLALLLVAVQLIPFVEFMKNSTGLGVDIEQMTDVYQAPPVLLLRSFYPSLFGNPIAGTDWSGLTRGEVHTYNPEFAVYCGIGTLLAAVAAVALIKTNRYVRVFTILLVVTAGLAISRLLLNMGYAVVPFLDLSKISRIAAVSCFALSALGGIGISKVMDGLESPERRRLLIATAIVGAVAIGVGLYVVLAGDRFVDRYLARAQNLPEEFWERTHQEMRSVRIREWAQGEAGEWVQYERRQVGRGFIFLIPTLGLLVVLIGRKGSTDAVKNGIAVALVGLVALDVGLNMRDRFISQVASQPFETEGIDLLKKEVGDRGMWRIRSARYQHEDIKALPPNTNILFKICSLNGTSTLWPKGYQQLYDAFGGPRPLSKRWEGQPVVGLFEALASDFGCVRYAVANNRGLPVLYPPLIRLVAAKAGIPSRARMMRVGNETRLAIWQRPGETLNFAVDVPAVRALDFEVGFDAASPVPGDSITVWLDWESNGEHVSFRQGFDIAAGAGKWYPVRLDVSRVSGGRVRMHMGCEVSGPGRQPVTVAWSGLDLVRNDCRVRETGGAYEISVEPDAESLALKIASTAEEVQLDILMGKTLRRVRWLAFPPHMPTRTLFLDIRQRDQDTIIVRSDSLFRLLGCDEVYMDAGCPDYDLIYDKDMYIYENLAAIRKGVCLRRDALAGSGAPGDPLKVSVFDEIGNIECGGCSIATYRPEEVGVDVEAAIDAVLLFQDVWYPGWKGYLDGTRADLLRTDIGMRAMEIPAGTHRVEMKYRPRSMMIGLALTCLGFLLSIVYLGKKPPEAKTTPSRKP